MVQAVTPLATPSNSWLQGLSSVFLRVALLEIEGPRARVKAATGMRSQGPAISLLDPGPLRWCLEAATPIVGWGGTPGAEGLIRSLGLEKPPRAFIVLPIVSGGKIRAFAYADRIAEPIPMGAVAELFAQCEQALTGKKPSAPEKAATTQEQLPAMPKRRRIRQVRRPRLVTHSHDGVNRDEEVSETTPMENAWVDALAESVANECVDESILQDEVLEDPLVAQAAPVAEAAPEVIEEPDYHYDDAQEPESEDEDADYELADVLQPAVADPAFGFESPVPQLALIEDAQPASLAFRQSAPAKPRNRRRWVVGGSAAATFAAAACALLCLVPLAPPPQGFEGTTVLRIPPQTSVPEMATMLEENGLIRNAGAFVWLARATGADRKLRAGSYRLSGSGWAWTLLSELERGQVQNVTITIPEGLRLDDIGELLSQAGIADSAAFVSAATSPELLERYGIPGDSAEGFLFPETYTFAQGLSAQAIAEIMVEQFYAQLTSIPAAAQLSNEELYERIVLASIVQREFKHPEEISKIAGVFDNRLKRAMRLESCATVQYILGKPKQRLMLSDLRIESPYNTYLQPGLPPGPIGNPSLAAITAALHPEKHEYLFFVAREDGSDRHIFNETFAAHQESQRRIRVASDKRASQAQLSTANAAVAQAPAAN